MIVPVATRLAAMVVTLFAASFIIYGALYLSPGDGPLAVLLGGQQVTPERIAAVKAAYHLDDPFFVQYVNWLGRVVTGDLGTSLIYRDAVSSLLGSRLVNTLWLVGLAGTLIVIGGSGLGILAAVYPRRLRGPVGALVSLGVAVPSFVFAIVLIALFAVNLGWFPVFGAGEGVADRLHHLILPAIALAATGAGLVARVTESEVGEQLEREHVVTARVRGIPERRVLRRHVIRNALVPMVTVSGLTIASLMAGAVVIERAFGLNGLGSFLVESVEHKDFAVVQAITLILVTAFVVVNTVVDCLYMILDPRMAARSR